MGAVCPALARCPGSHPRPVCATSPERFAPPMREKWTVEKSAGKTIPHLLAVRRALVPPVLARPGNAVLPTHGWGKQSVWLAASGAKRIFCGQKPAPTSRPVDRMSEGKRPAATSNILPSAQDDAVPIPRRFGENRWPPNCPRWKCSGFTAGLFSPGVRLSLDHRLSHATQRQEK